jgi:hypothetical protein
VPKPTVTRSMTANGTSSTTIIASSSKAGGSSCLMMRYFQDLTSLARQ